MPQALAWKIFTFPSNGTASASLKPMLPFTLSSVMDLLWGSQSGRVVSLFLFNLRYVIGSLPKIKGVSGALQSRKGGETN